MKTLSYMALATILLAHPGAGAAAERGGRGEEHSIRQTLAQYPEEVREAVCAVAGHPEMLVRLARIQQQSSADFAELLDPYQRKDQEALWDLARFPGLIEALAEVDGRDDEELNEVLDQYPAEIGPVARKWARRDTRVLAEIAALNQQVQTSSKALFSAYPSQAQVQARLLLQYPELVEMLEKDLDQVVLLGDAYRQDPDRVRQQLAQLHLERGSGLAARPRPGRYGEDKSEPPPRSRDQRYDYDLNGLDEPEEEARVEVVCHRSYYDYPYPYWFGYPRWYGPAGWYAGFNWRLTPQVSASIGIEVPLVRRPVPVVRKVMPVCRKVVPVYRPYVPHHGAGRGDRDHGRGHWKRRGKKH